MFWHHIQTYWLLLRAQVVAAELNTEGGKEYVTYKIRVTDGTDGPQWTVARRFRNFEELHRVLRANPAYKLKLPPKKVFFHNQVCSSVVHMCQCKFKCADWPWSNCVVCRHDVLCHTTLLLCSDAMMSTPCCWFFRRLTLWRSVVRSWTST